MKRSFFLLLSLFFFLATVTLANQKISNLVYPSVPEHISQNETQDDLALFFGYELVNELDIKKFKLEEDGRHLTFHFERIRRMKGRFSLRCCICKLVLCLVHLSLMLLIFTHLFH